MANSFGVPPAAVPMLEGDDKPVSRVWYLYFSNLSQTLNAATESSVEVGSSVSLATGIPATVTSINLAAGVWYVAYGIYFNPAVTTVITAEAGGIGSVSGGLPNPPAGGYAEVKGLVQAAGTEISLSGYARLVLVSAAPVFLVAQATFGVSTCGAYGFISARR